MMITGLKKIIYIMLMKLLWQTQILPYWAEDQMAILKLKNPYGLNILHTLTHWENNFPKLVLRIEENLLQGQGWLPGNQLWSCSKTFHSIIYCRIEKVI